MGNILVIDDEREVGTFFLHLLEEKGYKGSSPKVVLDFFITCPTYACEEKSVNQ